LCEDKAREALEAIRWPDGPFCPHCGNADQKKIAKGEGKAHRAGLYYCAACNGQFTVTVGTVMERSKIPLSKWLFATHLVGASKKGMSALQLQRMLGVTYKTAWFLCHRIREGHDAYQADGHSYSFHVANVTAKTLRQTIVQVVDRNSYLMTDELASYTKLGREFSGHGTANHSANEYVRGGGFWHVNTTECRFSLMKRAVFGTHHSVSEAHLHRYLVEWDFKFNTCKLKNGERAALIAKGIEGKRLTYRPTNEKPH
jgi:transposase-like protein